MTLERRVEELEEAFLNLLKEFENFKSNNFIPIRSISDVGYKNVREELICEGIKFICCSFFKLDENLVKSKTRKKEIVECREFIVYHLRRNTKLTLKQIGKLVDRDHSNVVYLLDIFERKLSKSMDFQLSNSEISYSITQLIKEVDLKEEIKLKGKSSNN